MSENENVSYAQMGDRIRHKSLRGQVVDEILIVNIACLVRKLSAKEGGADGRTHDEEIAETGAEDLSLWQTRIRAAEVSNLSLDQSAIYGKRSDIPRLGLLSLSEGLDETGVLLLFLYSEAPIASHESLQLRKASHYTGRRRDRERRKSAGGNVSGRRAFAAAVLLGAVVRIGLGVLLGNKNGTKNDDGEDEDSGQAQVNQPKAREPGSRGRFGSAGHLRTIGRLRIKTKVRNEVILNSYSCDSLEGSP